MRDVVEGDDLVIDAGRGQPGLDLGQVGRHQAIGWNRDDHDPRRPEVGGALQRRRPRDRGAAVHRPAGVGRDDDVDRPVGRGEQGEVSTEAEADESARPGPGVAQRVERPAHLVDHCTGIQRSQQREATLPAGLVIGQRETGLAAPEQIRGRGGVAGRRQPAERVVHEVGQAVELTEHDDPPATSPCRSGDERGPGAGHLTNSAGRPCVSPAMCTRWSPRIPRPPGWAPCSCSSTPARARGDVRRAAVGEEWSRGQALRGALPSQSVQCFCAGQR